MKKKKRPAETVAEQALRRIKEVANKHPIDIVSDNIVPCYVLDLITRNYLEKHLIRNLRIYHDLIMGNLYAEYNRRGYSLTQQVYADPATPVLIKKQANNLMVDESIPIVRA